MLYKSRIIQVPLSNHVCPSARSPKGSKAKGASGGGAEGGEVESRVKKMPVIRTLIPTLTTTRPTYVFCTVRHNASKSML